MYSGGVWGGGFLKCIAQLATTYVHIYDIFKLLKGRMEVWTHTNTEVRQYQLMSHILFFKGKSNPILGPCFACRFNLTKIILCS